MFDFQWSEFALIGIVALLFIGPKDMPVAIRTVTSLIKKGRRLAGEFQTHVDEMVREADLGEARDHLSQLRSFNVRGQIMRALDSDGSIRKTFRDDPLKQAPAGPRLVPRDSGTATEAPPAPEPVFVPDRPEPLGQTIAIEDYGWSGVPKPRPAEADTLDPAPDFLPPETARRLQAERAKPLAPDFLPPRSPHANPVTGRHAAPY